MRRCYRVKAWKIESHGAGVKVRIEATMHPAETTLPRIISLALPTATLQLGDIGKVWGDLYLGQEGDINISGISFPAPELESLFSLLRGMVTVCDDCDVSHCADLYRTPIETADSPEDWPYTDIGSQVFRGKYRSDIAAMTQAGERLVAIASRHPCWHHIGAVCAIPPSSEHGRGPNLPRHWAVMVADELQVSILELERTRRVSSQKQISDLAQRKANQAGSMRCASRVDEQSILVLDDLYMEGETMTEAARALRAAGAENVFGLCAVKTAKGTQGLDGLLEF